MSANPNEAACWCSSDVKCPHNFSGRLTQLWNETEQNVDEVIQQFDKKSIFQFLQHTSDARQGRIKDPRKAKSKEPKLTPKSSFSPTRNHISNYSSSNICPPIGDVKGAMSINKDGFVSLFDGRPQTSGGKLETEAGHVNRVKKISQLNKADPNPMSRSWNGNMFSAFHNNNNNDVTNDEYPGRAPSSGRIEAWNSDGLVVDDGDDMDNNKSSHLPFSSGNRPHTAVKPVEPDGPFATLAAGDTAIAIGLMRIGDILARKVLPWQGANCPRAVEALRDTRAITMQNKHDSFVQRMCAKLEDKVLGFLRAKEVEMDTWLAGEINTWSKALNDEEHLLNAFVHEDYARLSARLVAQEKALREREAANAFAADDKERDNTREQLSNFRKLCRADSTKQDDLHSLHASIEKAQEKVVNRSADITRDVAKNIEDAHDWLSCLGDNALTAAESERLLTKLFTKLDSDRKRALASLQSMVVSYTEQHNAILESIVAFSSKIHDHASDYFHREQLVSQGFFHFLTSILDGQLHSHSSEHQRSSVAWEYKYMADRAHRRDIAGVKTFNLTLGPFDKLVIDLRERMKGQLERITVKMQQALNGQDSDINKRKVSIHKRLAKHVNKFCTQRRSKLRDNLTTRKEEYEQEKLSVTAVNDLCKDLRTSIDQMWVKQHLRERRMYEAEAGRMERLEKSALIIWNNSAHLALRQSEEYKEWLASHRIQRVAVAKERRGEVAKIWSDWRNEFGQKVRQFSLSVNDPVKEFAQTSLVIDVSVSLEQSMVELGLRSQELVARLYNPIAALRRVAEENQKAQSVGCEEYRKWQTSVLIDDWNARLSYLNQILNRRVSNLKAMEQELEATIRSTLIQHEVEATLFEQNSCARLEEFWVEQRVKMANLAKELHESQAEYEFRKRYKGNSDYGKDRTIDDLLEGRPGSPQALQTQDMATMPLNFTAETLSGTVGLGTVDRPISPSKQVAFQEEEISDGARIKKILDEVRADAYREFSHKLTRGLERMKRDYGDGKKRLIAAYQAAKVLFSAADLFWDRAKLPSRCIGKVACRGQILFNTTSGMPAHSRALFCIGVAMSVLSTVPLVNGKLDCNDISKFLEKGVKRCFMFGLTNVTQKLGSFGENELLAECLWACSCCSIQPPQELLDKVFAGYEQDLVSRNSSDHKNRREVTKKPAPPPYGNIEAKGFFTDDPVDLVNSVLSVQEPPTNSEDPNPHEEEEVQISSIIDLTERVHLNNFLPNIQSKLSTTDITVMVALLGRKNSTIELTPHRFCQAYINWRRAAMAMVSCTLDPPGPEYCRIQDLISDHIANRLKKKKAGYSAVACSSPFEAVSTSLDWITSIAGLPISVVQALCLLIRAGSCDPWLEDPYMHCRKSRFADEVKELVETFHRRDVQGELNGIAAAFPSGFNRILMDLDVNKSGKIPLEVLRSYIRMEDEDLTNAFVTAAFWCLSRCFAEDPRPANSGLLQLETSGGAEQGDQALTEHHHENRNHIYISTRFKGSSELYMRDFEEDVKDVLGAMPLLDANVVTGMPVDALSPVEAHEIVSTAVKLDASARNAMPSSCCIWLGTKIFPTTDAVNALTLPGEVDSQGLPLDEDEKRQIGPGLGLHFNNKNRTPHQSLASLRLLMELMVLSKYPFLCENFVSDQHFAAAAGDEIVSAPGKEHWKELSTRRLGRVDKLTLSWRGAMMNEWAYSLYESRQRRHKERAAAIRHCVSVYHTQYEHLNASIVEERSALLAHYPEYLEILENSISEQKEFFEHHTSVLGQTLQRAEEYFQSALTVAINTIKEYQSTCGSIRREALERVAQAQERLKSDLARACASLVSGYTGGYAQHFFDDIVHRGEIWRTISTKVHGEVITEKEYFLVCKETAQRDLSVGFSDRLALDRMRTRDVLHNLASDTAIIQDSLAIARASCVTIQNEANSRIVIRIEKAMREARKLQSAAEQNPHLAAAAMSEIRGVLNAALVSSTSIIRQISDTSYDHLKKFEPLRAPHRDKMSERVDEVKSGWKTLEEILVRSLDDFSKEAHHLLDKMKAKCLEMIDVFKEAEIDQLRKEYDRERVLLLGTFRKHFREYDLSEPFIFDKFNRDIKQTTVHLRQRFGLSRPPYMTNALAEIDNVAKKALTKASESVELTLQSPFSRAADGGDDVAYQQMEVADMLCQPVLNCRDVIAALPHRFMKERSQLVKEVNACMMTNNGDMIRPQVVAVMDLLLAGIEIEVDFTGGYNSLIEATSTKSRHMKEEVLNFVDRLSDPLTENSIPGTVALIRERMENRREEVEALVEAGNSHMVADHSKMEVLLGAASKDIDDWVQLTRELVENSVAHGESKYVIDLSASPVTSPRLDDLPEEIDRVARLKALLLAQQEGTIPDGGTAEKKKKKNKKKKKAEQDEQPPQISGKPDHYREMQDGWLECYTADGYTYYFNPKTGESLWDIPMSLKKPLEEDQSVRLIETPRSLILGEDLHMTPPESPRTQELAAQRATSIVVKLDGSEAIMGVVGESRAVAASVVQIAIDITSVIRGNQRPRNIIPREVAEGATNRAVALAENSVMFSSDASISTATSKPLLITPGAALTTAPEDLFALGIGSKLEEDNNTLEDDESDWDPEGMKKLMTIEEGSVRVEGGDSMISGGLASEAEGVKQKLAEEHFAQSRERDFMGKEESISRKYNDAVEAADREKFAEMLSLRLSGDGSLYPPQLRELKSLAWKLRRVSVMEELADHDTSWPRLEIRVEETLLAEEEAAQLAERLKTDAGRRRQKILIEHAEDVDDMADFFRSAGLSKTLARQAAAESVLKHISTPKKLAKHWQRKIVELSELGLDRDDVEDVETALKDILGEKPAPQEHPQEIGYYDNSFYSVGYQGNYATSPSQYPITTMQASSPFQPHPQAQSSRLDFQVTPVKSSSIVPANDSIAVAADTSDAHYQYVPQEAVNQSLPSFLSPISSNIPAESGTSSFRLDPSIYQEVPDVEESPSHSTAAAALMFTESGKEGSSADVDHHADSLSQWSAYKSFSGGWIECYTEDGHTYFYNTATEESVWELPDGCHLIHNPADNHSKPSQANAGAALSHHEDDGSAEWTRAPRLLPVPVLAEVDAFSKEEGIARQLTLLGVQDKWQNLLVKCQFYLTEQKALHLKGKEEMYEKVSKRVDSRLGIFVDDIKYMQRTLKKELADLQASERDLRRMFEDESSNAIRAEKLTFVLDSLDKLKSTASSKYDEGYRQMQKFVDDWKLLEAELTQVGSIFDECTETNLEQCRMNCEHNVKVFVYEQLAAVAKITEAEKIVMRNNMRQRFKLMEEGGEQSLDADRSREAARRDQALHNYHRRTLIAQMQDDYRGYEAEMEAYLESQGLAPIDESRIVRREEEVVMSYLLTEIEMELALANDYNSVVEATKKQSIELQESIQQFDASEKESFRATGSWFDKQREAIGRHSKALNITIQKVRYKMEEGYQLLNAKLEALDFDVEQSAEEELAQGNPDFDNEVGQPDAEDKA